ATAKEPPVGRGRAARRPRGRVRRARCPLRAARGGRARLGHGTPAPAPATAGGARPPRRAGLFGQGSLGVAWHDRHIGEQRPATCPQGRRRAGARDVPAADRSRSRGRDRTRERGTLRRRLRARGRRRDHRPSRRERRLRAVLQSSTKGGARQCTRHGELPALRAAVEARGLAACAPRSRGKEAMSDAPTVHRFPTHERPFVNAYLVETASGAVAVDALLTISESGAMRHALEKIGKQLRAVLLTHSHPDHYAGLAQLIADDEDVPIIAPQGVIDTIARDDEAKDAIVGPMFGDEWPATRIFPNTPIGDGDSVTFDGVTFTVIDLGPSESPHDSPWVLGDGRTVFLGDQIYDHRHCYLADGHHEQW